MRIDPFYHQTPWDIVTDDNGQVIGVVYKLLGGDKDAIDTAGAGTKRQSPIQKRIRKRSKNASAYQRSKSMGI